MSKQVPVSDAAIANEVDEGGLHVIASDVAYQRLAIVNTVFFGTAIGRSGDTWTLIDAGLPGMAGRIRHAAAERFGENRPPAAIVLTHGHFDHVGALSHLIEEWDVPIYAHELELPYLNGTESYPPPDPSVGGGLMSLTSPVFPSGPFDFSKWLEPLPANGTVPDVDSDRL